MEEIVEQKKEKVFWLNKTYFFNSATGEQIGEKQKQLNGKKGCFVVATNMYPVMTYVIGEKGMTTVSAKDDEGNYLFSCMIYYKEKP